MPLPLLLQVVDGLLMTHLEDVNVTPEAFASACERTRYVVLFAQTHATLAVTIIFLLFLDRLCAIVVI